MLFELNYRIGGNYYPTNVDDFGNISVRHYFRLERKILWWWFSVQDTQGGYYWDEENDVIEYLYTKHRGQVINIKRDGFKSDEDRILYL